MPLSTESTLLASALAKAHKRLIGRLNGEFKTLGASFEIWSILQLLIAPDGKTMSELARESGMASPAATKLIDKLVNDNVVYRRHSRTDRRVVKIFMTDKGQEIITNGSQMIVAAIAGCSFSGDELTTLVRLLETVHND